MIARYYQDDAVDSVFNYFAEFTSGNPVVVMPTGTGKSIVIALFIKKVLEMWADQRFLILTHVQELVEQNSEKLEKVWAGAPFGVHSAGLNRRDIAQPVIFGGVASVAPRVEDFGFRDLVIIDECHLVSPKENTMYRATLTALLAINPNLRVIGLSATPYRIGQGMITDPGGLFTDICFDISGMDAFNRLIEEGFLCKLIPKCTGSTFDISSVKSRAGEFLASQLQKAVNKQDITYAALKEALEVANDRHCVIVFTSGIEHAEDVNAMLQSFGIRSAVIHSKISKAQRKERFAAFKSGELTALVGFRVLTTGFDHPPVDLIIDLYPTQSPGMHVQKYGRGTRPYDCNDPAQYIPGYDYVKEDCLVLDFAGNTARLGPINDPLKPRKPGDKVGEAPIKLCPEDYCGAYNHAAARECCSCGHEFVFGEVVQDSKLTAKAGTNELIRTEAPVVEYLNVDRVIYQRHSKKGSPTSIKVCYYSGLKMFNEYVCLEHPGHAGKKARDWWRQRHDENPPATTAEALSKVSTLQPPRSIKVWTNKHYPEVLSYEF